MAGAGHRPPSARKGAALTACAIELADAWLASAGVRVLSPARPRARASHVALAHPEARTLSRQLIDHGVRRGLPTSDVIRLGLSPLTTCFTDVYDALDRVRQLLSS